VTMSTLSPKGQALVLAGQRAYQPTAADRERVLGQLHAQLGDAALPANMSTAASAATAASSTWPLVSVVVVGVGLLGGALFYAWPRGAGQDKMQETKTVPVAATPQVIEPAAVPSSEQPASSVGTPPAVEPPALPATTAYRPKDRLAAEVAILSRATRDLRAARPAEALKALDEYRRKFPKGLLRDEHRAASAQALCALGRFDEANAKLAELPPQSPLAVRARQFCNASWARR
jgi:hypothetical protein